MFWSNVIKVWIYDILESKILKRQNRLQFEQRINYLSLSCDKCQIISIIICHK